MGRTIYQLLAAQAAGEPLSDADRERLTLHQQELQRAILRLMTMFPSQGASGTEFEALRERILGDLDSKDAPELREVVRLVLALAEFGDDFIAQAEGRWYRDQQHKQSGGQRSGRTRARPALVALADIATRQQRKPTLTDAAAARSYLHDTDPTWQAGTDEERATKVARLVRTIRRARKKTSTTN